VNDSTSRVGKNADLDFEHVLLPPYPIGSQGYALSRDVAEYLAYDEDEDESGVHLGAGMGAGADADADAYVDADAEGAEFLLNEQMPRTRRRRRRRRRHRRRYANEDTAVGILLAQWDRPVRWVHSAYFGGSRNCLDRSRLMVGHDLTSEALVRCRARDDEVERERARDDEVEREREMEMEREVQMRG